MKTSSQPVHVLMLSRDRQGLDAHSSTALRWKELVKQGIELEVWILSSGETAWSEPGIQVRGIGGKTIIQRLFRAFFRTPSIVPGLVTAQDPAELGVIAWRLARRLSAKYEIQDHGSWFDGSKNIDEPLWRFRFFLAKRLIQKADLIRSVSPQSVDWLAKHASGRAYWLPIVPGEEFRSLTHHPMSGRIVCVARFVPVKRHVLLLEAFAQVLVIRPDATLILVGDGPERVHLEKRVSELGLQKSVQFIGMVPAALHISSADAFVLLSSHEGWGVASVEAAMVGVPVIMSDTGSARWLAERGAAKIVTTDDPREIARTIVGELGKTYPPLRDVLNAEESAIKQAEVWKRTIHLL